MNVDEAAQMVFASLDVLPQEWIEENLPAAVRGWRPYNYLYVPNDTLRAKLLTLGSPTTRLSTTAKGQLMEEIAVLVMKCLKGCSSIKSYQSFAAQIDLAITGDSPNWKALMEQLRLPWQQRTIIVEAKYLRGKVNDNQFSRLCSILHTSFSNQASLGIFFTLNGATGFPRDHERLRSLHDAQATQLLFHAKTNKYVVVFDKTDLQQLGEIGSFPRLLEQKIRAVEEWTGQAVRITDSNSVETQLPAHLEQHLTLPDEGNSED